MTCQLCITDHTRGRQLPCDSRACTAGQQEPHLTALCRAARDRSALGSVCTTMVYSVDIVSTDTTSLTCGHAQSKVQTKRCRMRLRQVPAQPHSASLHWAMTRCCPLVNQQHFLFARCLRHRIPHHLQQQSIHAMLCAYTQHFFLSKLKEPEAATK